MWEKEISLYGVGLIIMIQMYNDACTCDITLFITMQIICYICKNIKNSSSLILKYSCICRSEPWTACTSRSTSRNESYKQKKLFHHKCTLFINTCSTCRKRSVWCTASWSGTLDKKNVIIIIKYLVNVAIPCETPAIKSIQSLWNNH